MIQQPSRFRGLRRRCEGPLLVRSHPLLPVIQPGCVPGECSGAYWNRPANITGQQADLGLGESVNWTTGMHPSLNRFRWEAEFTNPGGAAVTKYAYPIRVAMLSDYMSVEGETTNEWPGTRGLDASKNPTGILSMWRPTAVKNGPTLCSEAQAANIRLQSFGAASSAFVTIKYFAKVTGTTVGAPVAGTSIDVSDETSPTTLLVYDVVFGTTYAAGVTTTRCARCDSFTDWLDTFGYFEILGSSHKGYMPISVSDPPGTPYHGYEFTFAGGSYRPTGTVSNVLTLTRSNSTLTACGAASSLSSFELYMSPELPYIRMNNGSSWIAYAPEPNGAYIQSCISAETGDLHEHTVGSFDCVGPTVFLPYYGVEINSPARSLPINAPTSITVERVLLS